MAQTGREPERNETLWYGLLVLAVVALAVAGYAGYALYPRFNLPAVNGIGLLVLAAAAGIASFFSPCSFPLLVTLLARETDARPRPRSRRRQLGFAVALAIGAMLFLLLAGIVIALGGRALFAGVTFTSVAGRSIRAAVGVALILLGLIQLGVVPLALDVVEEAAMPLRRAEARLRYRRPTLGFALFGFGYLLAGFG